MVKKLFFIIVFVLCCCSGGNITEVGNPTKGASTTGTTQALISGVNGVLDSAVSGSFLSKFSNSGPVDYQVSEYECEFDESNLIETCDCSGGGTLQLVFEVEIEEVDHIITFDHSFSWTFSDCVNTACGEEVTLNGEVSGSFSGYFSTQSEAGEVSVTLSTAGECSGITSGGSDVGFEMTMTTDGATEDFSGTFCIDSDLTTFDSLHELEEAADPDGAC